MGFFSFGRVSRRQRRARSDGGSRERRSVVRRGHRGDRTRRDERCGTRRSTPRSVARRFPASARSSRASRASGQSLPRRGLRNRRACSSRRALARGRGRRRTFCIFSSSCSALLSISLVRSRTATTFSSSCHILFACSLSRSAVAEGSSSARAVQSTVLSTTALVRSDFLSRSMCPAASEVTVRPTSRSRLPPAPGLIGSVGSIASRRPTARLPRASRSCSSFFSPPQKRLIQPSHQRLARYADTRHFPRRHHPRDEFLFDTISKLSDSKTLELDSTKSVLQTE